MVYKKWAVTNIRSHESYPLKCSVKEQKKNYEKFSLLKLKRDEFTIV